MQYTQSRKNEDKRRGRMERERERGENKKKEIMSLHIQMRQNHQIVGGLSNRVKIKENKLWPRKEVGLAEESGALWFHTLFTRVSFQQALSN